MHITFAPKGILQIDEARIVFRNFAGAADKYNHEGNRNFAVVIDDAEIADKLAEDGWNVKIKPPREEGDDPFMFLPVKVKFNERGPHIYLSTGDALVRLDESTVHRLDNVDILSVDMDIRPYDWEMNGKTGRSAYLQSMKVTHEVDRFAAEFTEEEDSDDTPF